MAEATQTVTRRETKGTFLLGSLTLGHTAIHWYQALYSVVLPSIKAGLGLTDVQLGILSSVRQLTSGPLMLPSGVLADLFRRHTAIILALSFAFMGVAYFLVGLAPSYLWILPAIALVGVGTALWHPAAMSSLSLKFPQRRGSALAIHGVGASIGDTITPIVIGALLITIAWRDLLKLQLIPGVILALLLWRLLASTYGDQSVVRPSFGSYMKDMKDLVRHPVVLAIIGVNGLTGMARLSVMTFLPIYIQEELGYSTVVLGIYLALLYAMGAVSQPLMGYLSDRFGRKVVLVPSLFIFGLLLAALAIAQPGIQLVLVIGALGLFFYSLANVTQATVMDVASTNVQASTMGVTSVFGQSISLPGPVIAGLLITAYGNGAAFLFAGAVTLVAAILLAAVHVPRSSRPTPRVLG